jgi:hypothetical protein
MELIMIKIAQIIDKETLGQKYLETYKGELLVIPELSLVETFLVEVMEFEGDTPVSFIESKEVTLNINELQKPIRQEIEDRLLVG